jgi:site-specific DNA recombinase
MLVDTADHRTTANASLLRIIVRAHDIQTRLIHNSELTVHDIARGERVSSAYIYTLLRFLGWHPTLPRRSSMAGNRNTSMR